MSDTNDSKPDVEAIVDEIRSDTDQAERSIPDAERDAAAEANDLKSQLAEVNRRYTTCSPLEGWREIILRPLHAWRNESNAFNQLVVRILNRIVRILEGEDLPESGTFIEQHRRRLTLMEKMNNRLAEYDALNIEERLKKLEEKLDAADRDPKA